MPDQLLTIHEVADRLRVPVGTVRYWRHHNHGPKGMKLGRHVRFRESDLEQWLREQRQQSA